MPPAYKGRLGDLLIEQHLITSEQLEAALALQHEEGGKLGETLVNMGALDAQALAEGLAGFFGLVVVNLRRENVDPAVTALIPEAMAREQFAIPVRFEGDELYVAVAEPSDELRSLLSSTAKRPVSMMIAPMSDISLGHRLQLPRRSERGHAGPGVRAVEGARRRAPAAADIDDVGDNAPVVQVVDRILIQAMRDRASDVHIEPSEDVVRVRFRIDGALKEILQLPIAIGPGVVSRIKIMANMNIVERRRPQDGQLTIDDRR